MQMIHTIIVPQGAEYQAVCRGVSRVTADQLQVIAIPMGMESLRQFLALSCQHLNQPVLLMGLCGSLNQCYGVGDLVLYRDCIDQNHLQACSSNLTADIYKKIEEQVSFVKGLTSDCVISLTEEKSNLHEQSGTDIVDIEEFAFL